MAVPAEPGRMGAADGSVRRALRLAAWVTLLGGCGLFVALRFAHPDVTSVRLLLMFWPAALGVGLAGAVLAATERRGEL